MKLKKINLTLPNEPLRIYNTIFSHQKNSCIAGGFLSDLYMKKSYNDVDFFVKHDEKKVDLIINSIKELGYEVSRFTDVSESYGIKGCIYEMKKGKWLIQIIFTEMGINQIKRFDYSIREFIYFKGNTYASEEALESISEKKLYFGFTTNPLKALYRSIYLKSKFGFELDKKSFNRLFAIFNLSSYYKTDIKKFISSKSDKRINDALLNFIEKHCEFDRNNQINIPLVDVFQYPYRTIPTFNHRKISKDKFIKIFNPVKVTSKEEKFNLIDCKELFDYSTKKIDFLINSIKKERLKLITAGKSNLYFDFVNVLEKLKTDKTYIKDLNNTINNYGINSEDDVFISFWADDDYDNNIFENNNINKLLLSLSNFETSIFNNTIVNELFIEEILAPDTIFLRNDIQIKEMANDNLKFIKMPFDLGLCAFKKDTNELLLAEKYENGAATYDNNNLVNLFGNYNYLSKELFEIIIKNSELS